MTNLKSFISRSVFFALVLIVFSYMAGRALAPPAPPCLDCACKMALNWVNETQGPAYGAVDSVLGQQIRKGVAIGAQDCDTPPIVGGNSTCTIDKWTNFSRLCDGSQIRNPTVEASVTGTGQQYQTDVIYTICSPK